MEQIKSDVNPLARLRHRPEPVEPDAVLRPVDTDPEAELKELLRGLTAQGHYAAENILGVDAQPCQVVEAIRAALEKASKPTE